MATPQPPHHRLIATVCMRRVGRILAAVATFTRNLEFNPIKEEATLPRICNPRIGTPLNTKDPIFGQKVPAALLLVITVSDARDFVLVLSLSFS